MRGTTARQAICTVATLLLSSACYRYVPMETAAAAPGEPVRVYVTQAGAEASGRSTKWTRPCPGCAGRLSDGTPAICC